MTRPYAPRSVLRHLPLPLVRQFAAAQDIKTGPEWDALVEGDAAALYRAWLDLPPADRDRVERMLREVHELATPAGVRALVAEALYRRLDVVDTLEALGGLYAQSLWVYTAHPPVFHTARLLLQAANPGGRYWTLTAGFPGRPPAASRDAVQKLKLAVAHLYRTEQGRGQHCTVEEYARAGALYLFVYLDDYTHTHVGHDARGNLKRSAVRPAFEVVYVYTPARGALDLYAHGGRTWRAALRDLFCRHILDSEPPPARPGRRAYELGRLLDRDFPLAVDPAAGEDRASVRKSASVSAGAAGG
ncbi:MAG: hypothetical protein K2X82_10010 [Gemmataceae bacterium]|nr:hypothetical protein [Gemmataceae bacterium]